MNNGVSYEKYVQRIQQTIIDAQLIIGSVGVKVEHNVRLKDTSGLERQFDLYWEYMVAGKVYRNVIECKDYKSGVPIDRIDALVGKLMGFPDLHGILATPVHFDSGAIKKAKASNVSVWIVREEDAEKDWKTPNGSPLIRTTTIQLHISLPPTIQAVHVIRTSPTGPEIHIHELFRSDRPFLLDKATGKQFTLNDLFARIEPSDKSCELQTVCIPFENAVLVGDSLPVCDQPISAIRIDYLSNGFEEREIQISPELLGVVEEINNAKKRLVFREGVKTWIVNTPISRPSDNSQ